MSVGMQARTLKLYFLTTAASENSHQRHPEVAPILRVRRIGFAFGARGQQILRFAQDDALRKQSFSSHRE